MVVVMMHTGECASLYKSGTATAGKKARKGVFFGGDASRSSASSRLALAYAAPTPTLTSLAGGFRVQLIK